MRCNVIKRQTFILSATVTAVLAVAVCQSVQPAAADDFFKGKTVNLIAPSAVGGGYDLYTRFLGRFLGKHIPGSPSVVVKNMPGAGGLAAANYLANVAVPDGLTIALMQNTITLNQMTGMSAVKFDVRKMEWLGSMSTASTICALSGPAKKLTAQDLLKTEVTVGGSGGSTTVVPLLLNALAGLNLKLVRGYASTSNVILAMDRGEVDGLCGWSWDGARVMARDMRARDAIKIAVDIAIQPQPELHELGVPFLMDFLPESQGKEALKVILASQVYNRPFAAPPGTPADKVAIYRDAIVAVMKDPEVQAEAAKTGVDLQYLAPERIRDLIETALSAPQDVRDRAVVELKKAGFSD